MIDKLTVGAAELLLYIENVESLHGAKNLAGVKLAKRRARNRGWKPTAKAWLPLARQAAEEYQKKVKKGATKAFSAVDLGEVALHLHKAWAAEYKEGLFKPVLAQKYHSRAEQHATCDAFRHAENAIEHGLCPVGTQVQSILFAIDQYPAAKAAKEWAERHGFHARKVHSTARYHRLRQRTPSYFRRGSMKTIEFGHGIKAVVGCPRMIGR